MRMIQPRLHAACLSLSAGLLTLGPAYAAEYNYSTLNTPDHVQTTHASAPWVEQVRERTGGEIDFQIHSGGSLLPAIGVLKGLIEGVADGAFVTAGYVPAEMPLWNVIGDMGWEVPDEFVVAMAATEFGMLDPDGMADWRNNNVVFLGATSTPIFYFICKGAPQTLADFRGLRIRTAGNVWARFVEHIGAVPVNLPYGEVYTALERGALDCGNLARDSITTGARIGEVTDAVTMLPMGPFFSHSPFVFNEEFWQGATDEQRRIMLEEAGKAIVRMQIEEDRLVEANFRDGKAWGLEFLEPAPDLKAAYDAFVAAGLGGLHQIASERGVPNSDRALDSFSALLAKWKGLLDGVDRADEDALVRLFMTEVYDKVDPAAYGMD